jgi:alcohol dehydrogenase (cytochrome c)
VRGFLDAYDAETGALAWRHYTVPGPGDPGSDTWPNADVMARGGGGTWMTGSYDPELGLLYWGTGNPNPDYYGADRIGDNLYTSSTPHDKHDWDSNHVPVLAELDLDGRSRKVVMVANRNGFFYVLDRTTGELLRGTPYTATTWAREIGPDGRPIVLNDDGSQGCLPDPWGATNFNPPSYDPRLELFFVNTRETCATYHADPPRQVQGEVNVGGIVWTDRDSAFGALRALDAATGALRWEFRFPSPSLAGVMSTASGLVFAGDQEGNFVAFSAATGENLWHYQTGTAIWGAAAMTYLLDGRQQVLIPSGGALVSFALADD